MELIPLQIKTPQEIWDMPDAHLSEMLEYSYGVYVPWFNEIDKHKKENAKRNKKSQEYLDAQMQILVAEKKLEFVMIEWGEALEQLVIEQATKLGVQDLIDVAEVMDQMIDGRYMEAVYHRMTVQEYLIAILRGSIEEVSLQDMIVLNLI
jgi:hypothetical protein